MIYIGADHHGFELKAKINEWLTGRGYEFEDCGAFEYLNGDDFTDYAFDVAQKVAKNPEGNRGIVICGSGVGVSIAANKVKRIRCGLGFVPDQVNTARKDDNINVLAIAADNTDEIKAFDLVEQFLTGEFIESESYQRRIRKIERYEKLESGK